MNPIYEQILTMSHGHFLDRNATPELLKEFIERMQNAYPEYNIDEQYLFSKLESIHFITLTEDFISLEDAKGHEDWFNPSTNSTLTRKTEWHFWDHFRDYLLTKRKWPPKVITGIDNLSSQILSKLEDPNRNGKWDCRGMVMGGVQSGKTANYTGLITKAADVGYKLIIVLAGVHNSLRSQTQYRLNEEFLGYDLDEIQEYTGQGRRIGVGLMFRGHAVVQTLTSSNENGDFKRQVAMQAGMIPSENGDPIVLVLKKHVSILKNLINWATGVIGEEDDSGKLVVRNIPLLVIDDECDYASVNTREPERDECGGIIEEWDPTKTNQRIRKLLKSFEKSCYVGYTATPFANIFIHHDDPHPLYGEDLFPRSFIINLPHPSNYIGPDRLFGLKRYDEAGQEEIEPLPLIRDVTDSEERIPGNHKNGFTVDALPDSLLQAIKSFILVCTARRIREEGNPHNSMLVHVTRYTNVQSQIIDMVKGKLRSLVARIMSGSDSLTDFQALWEKDFIPTTLRMEELGFHDTSRHLWEEVKARLHDSAKEIKLKLINGTANDTLEYRDAEIRTKERLEAGEEVPWSEKGVSVIVVGGDKLSRGLTLEGLTISYYLRSSKMYDTLMQMGRWFGYKDGYHDLCRIYTTTELAEWYQHIAGVSLEFKDELDYMAALNSTPDKFGLKVRSHPSQLVVTSAGKSRNRVKVSISFSGDISETILFNPRYSEKNRCALENLINNIGRKYDYPVNDRKPRYRWSEISSDFILNFLREYKMHKDFRRVDPARLADYIEKQNKREELTEWEVVIVSHSNPVHSFRISTIEMGCITRTPVVFEDSKISIKRIVSPADECIDLTPVELDKARDHDRLQGKNVSDREIPSGKSIRLIRPEKRGLLIIYFPANNDGKPYGLSGNEIVGFAISFPESKNAEPIEYWVGPVYEENQ